MKGQARQARWGRLTPLERNDARAKLEAAAGNPEAAEKVLRALDWIATLREGRGGLVSELDARSADVEALEDWGRDWTAAARAFAQAGDRLLRVWPTRPAVSREQRDDVDTVVGWFRWALDSEPPKSVPLKKRGPAPEGLIRLRDRLVVEALHAAKVPISIQKASPRTTALGKVLRIVRQIDDGRSIENVFTPAVVATVQRLLRRLPKRRSTRPDIDRAESSRER